MARPPRKLPIPRPRAGAGPCGAGHRRVPVTIGGSVDQVQATLRVAGKDLDPEAVTRLLGVAPSRAACAGPGTTGYWSLDADPEPVPEELENLIHRLLARLPVDPAVWRQLAALGQPELFCGLFLDHWVRECTLSPAVHQALAERGLPLRLDIYGP